MDPCSKVDYSRLIREASMAMEKLPEMNPTSGRVPGQGLLASTIWKRRRGKNREEITKKGSTPRVFGTRGKYRLNGSRGVDQGVQVPPRCSSTLGRATRAPGPLVGPFRSSFGDPERFLRADFL